MSQIQLHRDIRKFLESGPSTATPEAAQRLIATNADGKRYFFAVADASWLSWFDKNGFLDEIRKPAQDTSQLRYSLPELDYLVRIAKDAPENVTEVALSLKFTSNEFNPEVMDRFIWLAADLPINSLEKLVQKIHDDNWIFTMRKFINSGFTYERIITKIAEANAETALLAIAEALLLAEVDQTDERKRSPFATKKPFVIPDITDTGIFEQLVKISDESAEVALSIASKAMSRVVLADNEATEQGEVFKVQDSFYLLDVDFFELHVGGRHSSDRDDVRNLAAVITNLSQRIIGGHCGDEVGAERLLNKYIDPLPDSRSMWRLRLFVLSLCPVAFKDRLRDAFFRLFSTDRYFEIDTGTEYKKALKSGFKVLSEPDQRKYVADVFEYFTKQMKNHEDQKWHKRNGWEILASITSHLTLEEKVKCKEAFGRDSDDEFEPRPEISHMRSGFVSHQSPVNLKDYTVDQIIEGIKTEWKPEVFKEKFKQDDFLNPRGVEGLGDDLKADLKARVSEYTDKAPAFFDREQITPYYTYSFLRSIEELVREDRPSGINWEKMFELFSAIAASGTEQVFEREEKEDTWRANWISVHDAIADILIQTVGRGDRTPPFDFTTYRSRIFDLLSYLFTVNDPIPENEKPEYGDLFHVAINSVRGRAFQAFVQFIYPDGDDLKDDVIKIKDDAKQLYKKIAENDTALSMRFVLGHYLASFYFRDKDWMRGLLPFIFPTAPDKKDLYLAGLEGYLTSTLYGGLFEEMEVYYTRAVEDKPENYTQRKYTKDIDEALGTHIALAFMHFSSFGFENPLFLKFWSEHNLARQREFVSFAGRYSISPDSAGDSWFSEHDVSKENLMKFWDWILEQQNIDPETYAAFGFWINPNKEVLDTAWLVTHVNQTLNKSVGRIDWDHALTEQLQNFAATSPVETLQIMNKYLLNENRTALNPYRKTWLHVDRNERKALEALYKNEDTKAGVVELIDKLIEIGSAPFWELESIVL